MDPRLPDADRDVEEDSLGMPRRTVLEDGSVFVTTLQRAESTNPQLTYRWETVATPQSEAWSETPQVERNAAAAGWETVIYAMPKAVPERTGMFGRLRVELQQSISYP